MLILLLSYPLIIIIGIIASATPSDKKKEGYLEIDKGEGVWKKYYFMLFTQSLSYFNQNDKVKNYIYVNIDIDIDIMIISILFG